MRCRGCCLLGRLWECWGLDSFDSRHSKPGGYIGRLQIGMQPNNSNLQYNLVRFKIIYQEYMICFSILVATMDVIGNKERLQIGRLFIIDLSKHTLSPIDKWCPFQAANLLLILLTIVFHMRWRCTNRQAQILKWHPLHPTY